MRASTVPRGDTRRHSPSVRTGRTHAASWQGVPSLMRQSRHDVSSRAKPRPSSRVSTPKRSSTSGSTTAICWMGSWMRTGRQGSPSWSRSRAYAMPAMPEDRWPEKSTGTASGSRCSKAVRTRSRGIMRSTVPRVAVRAKSTSGRYPPGMRRVAATVSLCTWTYVEELASLMAFRLGVTPYSPLTAGRPPSRGAYCSATSLRSSSRSGRRSRASPVTMLTCLGPRATSTSGRCTARFGRSAGVSHAPPRRRRRPCVPE